MPAVHRVAQALGRRAWPRCRGACAGFPRAPCTRPKSSAAQSSPFSEKVNQECLDSVVPFDARFLEALDLKRVSEPSEFEVAVSAAFDRIDQNGDGTIDRAEAEELLRDRLYACCPPQVWSVTPEQLLQKMGGTGHRVTRAEFSAAVERIADTLDRRVWPLAQSQFFSAIMFAINQPLMPLLVRDLGISMTQFGGIVALMPLIRVALAFPATFFANRYGRKPLTVEGQLIAAVGFGCSALVASPWQLILSRLVIGAGTSFAGVGQQNMLGDIATGRTRSRVFAPGMMLASLAFAVGPATGGWLASTIGVQATYLAVGAGMACVSLRNHFILTETLRVGRQLGEPSGAQSTPEVVAGLGREWLRISRVFAQDHTLRTVTLANACYNFTAISSKFVLLPMLALDTWGLGASGLGLALGAISLLQSLASRPAAYIADVYGRDLALLPGLGLAATAMVIASTGAAPSTAVPLVCGTWALGAAFVGSVPAAIVLDASSRLHWGQQDTSRALALSRVVGDLGMVAGSVVSGALLSSLGAPAAFGVQAGVLTTAAAGSAYAMLRAKR